MAKLLAMILAGGEGRRLDPLTRERAKPAVPFGGRYRIIDFVLSNFANSGVLKMKVLVQYKSESLNAHIQRGLAAHRAPQPVRRDRPGADARRPEVVRGLGRRHLPEPQHHHRRGAGAHLRVRRRPRLPDGRPADARLPPGPEGGPHRRGDPDPGGGGERLRHHRGGRRGPDDRLRREAEGAARRPCRATRPAASPRWGTTSSPPTRSCRRLCATPATRTSAHDFGKSIVASMYERKRVYVYDFAKNVVPGPEREGARLLARRRAPRGVLPGQHGPRRRGPDLLALQRPVADLHGPAQLPAGEVRLQQRAGGPRRAAPPTRSCRRAASSRAATSTTRSCRPRCA